MIHTFLKIFSTLLLIGVLVLLVQKRDFILHPTKGNSSIKQSSFENTIDEIPPLSSLEKDPTPSNPSSAANEKITQVTEVATTIAKEIVEVTPYIYQNEGVSDTDESYRPQISPCNRTTSYKIGTFDTRFGISKEDFIHTIDEASSLWEDAAHKNLFVYDQNGSLTINLIYDERQSNTEDINNLTKEIENSKESAEQLKMAYEQEKVFYTTETDNLIKDGESFQLRYKAYSDKVTAYNAKGGASKIEYDAMTSELAALQQEAKILDGRRLQVISITDSINKKVVRYNEFVSYINDLIKKSNSLGAKKFTEGKFVPSSNTIDIYQYANATKLLRVLAHELGHTLGINHTANRYSIMYSVNSATTTELTTDDKEALAEICQ